MLALEYRGYDLPNTPIVLSRLIIRNNTITLYVDLQKVPDNLKFTSKIIIKDINSFDHDISKFSEVVVFIEKQVSFLYIKHLVKTLQFK